VIDVSDLEEKITAADPAPVRPRRVVLLVVVATAVAALVAGMAVALRGPDDAGAAAESAAPRGAPPVPGERLDTEAAVRNGWTMTANDEFEGDALDEQRWGTYRGRTTDDVGQHDPDNITVSDGALKLTSRGNTSAGLEWLDGQRYGRWEVRARAQQGNGYGPVLLLWPDAEDWPEGGEIDIMEIPKGDRTKAHFTVHWGEDNEQDGRSVEGDFTQWHTFAVEWTPEHVVGFVDGVEIYRNDDSEANPPRSMHLAIQQDIGPYGKDWIPAPDATTPDEVTFEVDWVRIYAA
jgi:beta-glucanase (GH16 family)